MKALLITMLIIGVLVLIILGLPLRVGIWVPDIIAAPKRTLAEKTLTNGHSFKVIQYWNRVDFYTTELLHTSPAGSVNTHVLDGDDSKSWSLPLVVDEQNKTATITLSGERTRKIHW
jgi:hypothetical protein